MLRNAAVLDDENIAALGFDRTGERSPAPLDLAGLIVRPIVFDFQRRFRRGLSAIVRKPYDKMLTGLNVVRRGLFGCRLATLPNGLRVGILELLLRGDFRRRHAVPVALVRYSRNETTGLRELVRVFGQHARLSKDVSCASLLVHVALLVMLELTRPCRARI